MKKLYSIVFVCGFISWCQAQENQMLTNDVAINERGARLTLFNFKTMLTSTNMLVIGTNSFIGDQELQADQPNYWILHNPSSNRGAVLPERSNGGCFALELKTTTGISLSKTDMGKKMSEPPKSLTDIGRGHSQLGSASFPALTNLFNFPSNGVYVFELRCWAWQNSKKQFALSDPIRVRVIEKDTNNPPSVTEPARP